MSTIGIATAALERARFRYARETDLHRGLEQVFTGAGLAVRREVHLGDDGRIDFVLTHAVSTRIVGVEVKVASSPGAVLAQLLRYAPHFDDLLLVTTRHSHRRLHNALLDVDHDEIRVHVHHLRGGGL